MERERLTQNPGDIKFCNPCYLCKHPEEMPKRNKHKCSIETCDWLKCWDELAKLEDEIEQGLWLKLPVPLGTIVYGVDCDYDSSGDLVNFVHETPFIIEMLKEWGKTVFATEPETKNKLRQYKEKGFKVLGV